MDASKINGGAIASVAATRGAAAHLLCRMLVCEFMSNTMEVVHFRCVVGSWLPAARARARLFLQLKRRGKANLRTNNCIRYVKTPYNPLSESFFFMCYVGWWLLLRQHLPP